MIEPNPVVDQREFITQDAFRVSPELLGRRLAKPWRRAAAMAIDGVLLAILSNTASVFLGIAAVYVLFRISRPSTQTGYIRKSVRLIFRISAAAILFVVILSIGGRIADIVTGDDEEVVASSDSSINLEGMQGVAVAAEILAFRQAATEEDAIEAAESLRERLIEAGGSVDEVREILTDVTEGTNRPWLISAVDSVLAVSPTTDTLVASPTTDTIAAAEELDSLSLLLSEIENLESQQVDLIASLDDARDAAEDQEGSGILSWFGSLADDLGLGLGWSGLYFTAFLTLGRGRTPGKRLMGIRVIRLDGLPIGWWAAFERFGGYAASFATGLLGFFQILWDDNRQAIHDKIAFTVVERE